MPRKHPSAPFVESKEEYAERLALAQRVVKSQLTRRNRTTGWQKITTYHSHARALEALAFWNSVYRDNGLEPVMVLSVTPKL